MIVKITKPQSPSTRETPSTNRPVSCDWGFVIGDSLVFGDWNLVILVEASL
jgi:hypothetical protein